LLSASAKHPHQGVQLVGRHRHLALDLADLAGQPLAVGRGAGLGVGGGQVLELVG
jgi:hypothetical protein